MNSPRVRIKRLEKHRVFLLSNRVLWIRGDRFKGSGIARELLTFKQFRCQYTSDSPEEFSAAMPWT